MKRISHHSAHASAATGITGDYDSTEDIDVLAGGIEDGMTQMLKACA